MHKHIQACSLTLTQTHTYNTQVYTNIDNNNPDLVLYFF